MFRFVRHHIALSLAFAAALAVTLVFAGRLAVSTIVWSDPDRYEAPIAGWMTPRYVARSWSVAPDALEDALRLDTDRSARRMTIAEIAAAQGRSLDELIGDLDTAIAAARSTSDD